MDWLSLVFPKSCVNCHKTGQYLCKDCLSSVSLANPVCPACKRFSYDGCTHDSCKSDIYLEGASAIWRYEGVIRKAILKLKYNFVSDISKELAEKGSEKVKDSKVIKNAIFVPIPLHKKRANWRGFNQSQALAKHLSVKLNVLCATTLLVRIEQGVNQASLDRVSRLRNMRGKYAVNVSREALAKWDKDRRIVLIDDVWTTGSTLNEAARVLKEAGAREVWGLTIAR